MGVVCSPVVGEGNGTVGQLVELEGDDGAGATVVGPPLPLGRRVELPGRGTTFVREVEGPPGAPTLLLLHGWIASAGLNWFQAYEALGRHFRIIAPDLRGHGRGLRALRRFRLADCADDAAALLDELDAGPVIAVGYSMGGPVSQLLWKRHPEKVRGLVLAATTRLGQLAAHVPSRSVQKVLPVPQGRGRPGSIQRWAAAEMRRHDPRALMEAGHAIGTYDASRWIGRIDVPTTVLVTTEDRAIQPTTQLAMARAIPGSEIHLTDAGHVVCARPEFAPPLVDACTSVAERV